MYNFTQITVPVEETLNMDRYIALLPGCWGYTLYDKWSCVMKT